MEGKRHFELPPPEAAHAEPIAVPGAGEKQAQPVEQPQAFGGESAQSVEVPTAIESVEAEVTQPPTVSTAIPAENISPETAETQMEGIFRHSMEGYEDG